VDLHCHCLPGLDDGPATVTEALSLCHDLVADGFTTVVATPHQLGRYDGRSGNAETRAGVAALNDALGGGGLPLRALPGAEVRIDERIPSQLARNDIMTLADGGRYLLVELPGEAFITPMRLAGELAPMGVTTILAHPERCGYLQRMPELATPWVQGGVHLQLTAASIVGVFGRAAQAACWHWLRSGAAWLVATDAHGGERRPRMSDAMSAISRRLGPAVADRVCLENPRRVLRGETMIPPWSLTGAEVGQ